MAAHSFAKQYDRKCEHLPALGEINIKTHIQNQIKHLCEYESKMCMTWYVFCLDVFMYFTVGQIECV